MARDSGRWWEFYFVRYAVGTLVGAIVIYAALEDSHTFKPFLFAPQDPDGLGVEHLILYAVYGLTFCYVASVPLLVWHALRGYLGVLKHKYVLAALAVVIVGLLVSPFILEIRAITATALIANAVVVLPTWVMVIQSFCTTKKHSCYYTKVANERSNPWNREYVESYRHLREHGNSLFIVLMELLMGLTLYVITQQEPKYGVDKENGSVVYLGVYLVVWILPGALIWFAAQGLERRMVKGSKC